MGNFHFVPHHCWFVPKIYICIFSSFFFVKVNSKDAFYCNEFYSFIWACTWSSKLTISVWYSLKVILNLVILSDCKWKEALEYNCYHWRIRELFLRLHWEGCWGVYAILNLISHFPLYYIQAYFIVNMKNDTRLSIDVRFFSLKNLGSCFIYMHLKELCLV